MRLLAFLRGDGRDGRGRLLADILAADNATLEAVHDYIQWLFPLREGSGAVPGSPVLSEAEALAIRGDARAAAGVQAGLARMRRFYAETDAWLAPFDHNHLRISRILASVRDLLGEPEAEGFHAYVLALHAAAGGPVNANSRDFWRRAAAG